MLGSGPACAAASCLEIRDDGSSVGDGTYSLVDITATTYDAWCDMTRNFGGWTLVGSVVNEGSRHWSTFDVWTDFTTFGSVTDRQTADHKSTAFFDVPGTDLLVATDEYAFSFDAVLGAQDLAAFIAAEYDAAVCSTTFLASGADWAENLTEDQISLQSLVVRAWDNNCDCFPGCNENSILSMQLSYCCWVNGLGNGNAGQPTWSAHDNSLLTLSSMVTEACTPGVYPCNDDGVWVANGYNCYDTSCKTTYGEIYVR